MLAARFTDSLVQQQTQERFQFSDAIRQLLQIRSFVLPAGRYPAMFKKSKCLSASSDHPARNTGHCGPVRNGMDYYCSSAYFDIVSEPDAAKHRGACAHYHPIADRGVTFAAPVSGTAQRHSLIQQHVITDLSRLSDDYAEAVVDEQPLPDLCSGMNLDSGHETRELRDQPRKNVAAVLIKRVREAMEKHSVQARVAK